jgi:hypothetical protein
VPLHYDSRTCAYDEADHDRKRKTYWLAYMRNQSAVRKVAQENSCVERVNISPYYLIPRLRINPETIDERLNKALDDQFRPKDGYKYPFEDIVGEEYFSSMTGMIRRAEQGGPIRMMTRNSFLNHEVIMYITGILRDGVFVAREGFAGISMQLRKTGDPQLDIWCVPFGFSEDCKELNGLFIVTGPLSEEEMNPHGLAIRITSKVGRLQIKSGCSLTFDDGNGGLLFKEECDVEIPQPSGTVPEEIAPNKNSRSLGSSDKR